VKSPAATGLVARMKGPSRARRLTAARRRATQSSPQVSASSIREEILLFLDDTFGRRNWGHTGLLPALRGLGVQEAQWMAPGVPHSVWQQINHIIHWKTYILRRVQGQHPRVNQAWPPAGQTDAELRRTMSRLATLHAELRRAILALAPGAVEEKSGKYSFVQLLLASAAHESYHIGQILLTRKLYRRHR
jgi:uncharacterized damage-inducible protein DinB